MVLLQLLGNRMQLLGELPYPALSIKASAGVLDADDM